MSADFTPSLGNYQELSPFRFWCQKVLPLVYDDSLSYYELLCKVVDFLNKTMQDVNTLADDVTNLHEAYVTLQNYVNTYFDNLDVQQEINEKLDEMVRNGTFNNIITPIILSKLPPKIVESTAEMTDKNMLYILKSNSHIYQYIRNSFQDTGIVFGGDIANALTYRGIIPANFDANDAETQTYYLVGDTNQPEHLPVNKSGFLTTLGQPNLSAIQLYRVFGTGEQYFRNRNNLGSWSAWLTEEDIYLDKYFVYKGTAHALNPKLTNLNAAEGMSIYVVASGQGIINMPVEKTGFLFTYGLSNLSKLQYYVVFDNKFECYYRSSVSGNPSSYNAWNVIDNYDLKYLGTAHASTIQLTDLNNAKQMSGYFVSEGKNIQNMPVEKTGLFYSFGDNNLSHFQLYYVFEDGVTYYRRTVYGNPNSFEAWTQISTVANKKPSMYSIGNSILTGSVWVNGMYNHLTPYYNSPYAIIADAIGIIPEKVEHKLLSSTGLLFNPGKSGNFLNNIKKKSFAGIDVCLTHLWLNDMDATFSLGTIDSVKGDGSIAGAVYDLVDYLKSSNGLCKLILVGIPPVSTTIYGENVFTGLYPNGKSIHECNTLLHELAKKLKFTFIDWEDLNLSYYYHDFTDGLNVHAKNEATYRAMGGYLGGKAAKEIRF